MMIPLFNPFSEISLMTCYDISTPKLTSPHRHKTDELAESHAVQIDALRAGVCAEKSGNALAIVESVNVVCAAADVDESCRDDILSSLASGTPLLEAVWASTGNFPKSLFAYLPGCLHCLTQAKAAYGRGAESDDLADALGLMDNPRIPAKPSGIKIKNLEEFSRLQILARDPQLHP